MREKLTINKKISQLKFKKPSRLCNFILMTVAGALYKKSCNVTIDSSVDLKKYKGKPLLIVSNHASRMDYAFVGFALKGRRINYVAAENEFHRSKFSFAFSMAHIIPKKNFVPDITTIRGMAQVLRKEKEATVCIFPCGMSTISGAQQPSMLGSGKMLKHFGVTVLGVRIHGGYFVSPKFDITERHGKVEVELFEMFSPEQLSEMSPDEIQEKMDEQIYTDDCEWNKERQNSYKVPQNGAAYNLHELLYKCPACGKEMQMKGEGDTIRCLACGNTATLDDKYNLRPTKGSKVPENIVKWYNNQRRALRRQIQQGNFVLEEHVKLGVLPDYDYLTHNEICKFVGDGVLRLDMEGLHFNGVRDEKPFEVHIKSDLVNVLCIPTDGTLCYTYASGEFLEFVPDSPSSIRWSLAVEEVYRANGGKWQNYKWFDYEHDDPLIEG